MQAMADIFEDGEETTPFFRRETVSFYAIEFMRYIHECKIALLGEMGEQPEFPAITQPIHKHDTIFNNAKPEEFFRKHVVNIAKALNHSEDRTVTRSQVC